jgi:hypothetical protein
VAAGGGRTHSRAGVRREGSESICAESRERTAEGGPDVKAARVSARVAKGRSGEPALRVSRRQVLAFRMGRVGLGERVRRVEEAVGEVGLPDFPPGAAQAALAPRLAEVSSTALEEAYEARTLVRVRAMRGAPVVVRPGDVGVFTAGLLPADERAMRAFIGPAAKTVDSARMEALEAVALLNTETRRALAGGPVDRDALHAELRRRVPRGLLPYCRACDSHHVHPSLVYAVALSLPLVVFPREDGPYLLALAEGWLDGRKAGAAAKAGAGAAAKAGVAAKAGAGAAKAGVAAGGAAGELLRRFLRVYGPSTVGDFASWAGIGGGQPQAIWESVKEELVPVALEGSKAGSARWMLGEDRGALAAAAEGEPPVRLLSPGDPLLQSRDRETLVPERAVQAIVWKNLAPAGVLIAGAEIVATTRAQKKKDRLEIEVKTLRKVSPAVRRAGEEEGARLAGARGLAGVTLRWV